MHVFLRFVSFKLVCKQTISWWFHSNEQVD